MKRMTIKVFLASTLLFIGSFCQITYAQDKQIDKYAQETVDRFLKGMSIYELPEGKEMVAATGWPQWGNQPVLLKYETLFEAMLDTDMRSIKGYKRLIDAQVKSKAGTPLPERCLLIAYPSSTDGKWRVLVLSTGTDVQSAVAYGEKHLSDTRYGKDQFNYRFLALWYAAAGRLNDSYRTYKTAADLNRKDPSPLTPQSDFDIHVETIRQIMGN